MGNSVKRILVVKDKDISKELDYLVKQLPHKDEVQGKIPRSSKALTTNDIKGYTNADIIIDEENKSLVIRIKDKLYSLASTILGTVETPTSTQETEVSANLDLPSHSFIVGDVIYYNKTNEDPTLWAWEKAKADKISTLGMFLVVGITADTIKVAQSGRYTVTAHSLTVNSYYYLSATVAGELTLTAPSIKQPIIYVDTANTFWVLPFHDIYLNSYLNVLDDVLTTTTGENINLAADPIELILSMDGFTVLANTRYLLRNQSSPSQNGIYVILETSEGSGVYQWVRTDDFPTGVYKGGVLVKVTGGNTQYDKIFVAADKEINVGTDLIFFVDITGSGATGSTTLAGLTDTTIGTLSAGQSLRYSGTTWANSKLSLINGDINDVILGSPSNGQVLKYDTGKWVNGTVSAGTVADIGDITNVTITDPSSGQVLKYNGSIWVNGSDEVATSGTGEINTASNLGAGTGLYAVKVGADLRFKSLVEGTNVTLSSDANTVTINAGEATTLAGLSDTNIGSPSDGQVLKWDGTNNYWYNGSDETATGGGSGTVTSVGLSAGTTGFSVTNTPITTSGDMTLSGVLNVANGGTGANNANAARTNLGFTGAVTNIVGSNLPTNMALVSNADGKVAESSITKGELEKLDGIKRNIETEFYGKASRSAWNIFGEHLDKWKIKLGLIEAPKKNWIQNGSLETDVTGGGTILPFITSNSGVTTYTPATNVSSSLSLGGSGEHAIVGQNIVLPKRRDEVNAVLSFDIKRDDAQAIIQTLYVQVYQGTSAVDLTTMSAITLDGRRTISASIDYIKEEGATELINSVLIADNYYLIADYKTGDSFTNVGASSNASGIVFQATGTTPITWTNGTILIALTPRPKTLDVETGLTTTYERMSFPFKISATAGNYLFVEFIKYNDSTDPDHTVSITNIVLNLGQIAPTEAVYADSVEDLLVSKEIEKAAFIINNLFAISDGGKIMLKNDLYEYKTSSEPSIKIANVQTGVCNTTSLTTEGTGSTDPYEEYKTLG